MKITEQVRQDIKDMAAAFDRGVEARLSQYLEVWEHISEKKEEGLANSRSRA